MINLGKFNARCNAVDGLSTKISAPSETRDSNVKVFNMITKIKWRKNIGKIYFMFKFNTCNSNQKCNSNEKWDDVSVNVLCVQKGL